MSRRTKIWFLTVAWVLPLLGCQEQGLIRYEDGALDGYTILAVVDPGGPDRAGDGVLVVIDMLGEEVHRYSTSVRYGKMVGNGDVLGVDEVTPGERAALSLVQETWDGVVVWSYAHWEEHPDYGWIARQHHDLQREGNPVGYYAPGQDYVPQGNTLVLAHADEDRPDISPIPILDDIIYEIDWAGNHTPEMFEWHAVDHLEEFGLDDDARQAIYVTGGDWLHLNAISWLGQNRWWSSRDDSRFDPRNILICSRGAGFIAILDHETGEVVWRVGPDYLPGQPAAGLDPLIGMHHAHMIPAGLPGEGNILVFDNGGASGWGGLIPGAKYVRLYSRVLEFDPTTLEKVWEYSPTLGDNLPFSFYIGGAQRLPNGNTLITSGATGHLLEVTPDKEVVWEFGNPIYVATSNAVYRAFRIPPERIPGNPVGYDPWE